MLVLIPAHINVWKRYPLACALASLLLLLTPVMEYAAANEWMRAPTAESSPDDVLGPIRAARNAFFDRGIGAASPLTPNSASALHLSEGSHYQITSEPPPEIPVVSNRAIITGTFISHRSVLTASRRAIYTEVKILVGQVFETSKQVSHGSTITIALPGGSIKTAKGILSYLTDPKEYFIQPGKRYLFVLSYHPRGVFYSSVRTWSISGGTVRPNSRAEQARANAGESHLVGIAEGNLVPALRLILSSEQKK